MKATFAQRIQNIIIVLTDIVYPRFCFGCENFIEGKNHRYICKDCHDTLEYTWRQRCAFCSGQTIDGKTCAFCKSSHSLDQLINATDYEQSAIKNAIHAYKYEFTYQLQYDLAPILNHAFEKYLKGKLSPHETLLIPIPLHWSRRNWRGYNQSELLAQYICHIHNFALKTNILKRRFQWRHQAEMDDRTQRINNSRDTFYIKTGQGALLKDKTVILVDDVATTGSTLDEASRLLKKYGVKKVIALVLARGG